MWTYTCLPNNLSASVSVYIRTSHIGYFIGQGRAFLPKSGVPVLFVYSTRDKLTVKYRPKRYFSPLLSAEERSSNLTPQELKGHFKTSYTTNVLHGFAGDLGKPFRLLWFLVSLKMPYFELSTNVKQVPAEFLKETTNLIAELLGKPSSVSVHLHCHLLIVPVQDLPRLQWFV